MTSKTTARNEIEARIETLARQVERSLYDAKQFEDTARKRRQEATEDEALRRDWETVLHQVDAVQKATDAMKNINAHRNG